MKIFQLFLLSTVLVIYTACAAPALRVGFHAGDITPPPGMPLAGYYNTRLAESTNDPLHARALVLDDGRTRAAIVVLDLISTTRPMVEETRRLLAANPGIRHVMISATHSHTGPILSGSSVRVDVQGGQTDLARDYMRALPEKIADTVRAAHVSSVPADPRVATAHAPGIAFNRRFFMKDGSVGWNPGKLNSNIVHTAGPTDPALPFVSFERTGGPPIALYLNFAMHPDTVGGLQFSADYQGALARALLREPGAPALVSLGTAGDINHVDVSHRAPQKGITEAQRIGDALAGALREAWPSRRAVEGLPLLARSETVALPLPVVAPADVEKARAIAIRAGTTNDPAFIEKVEAFKVLDVAARQGKPQEVEVQVISLGTDIAWVGLPGEIFVELGLDIKRRSPFSQTIVASLANGAIGYIPTRRGFEQGNYEPISARCSPGSGELLVDVALRLLRELHANAQPKSSASVP